MEMRVVFILVVLGIVQCQSKLSCSDIKRLVNGHNERRLKLASGKVSGQPAASKMNIIVWDEELASKASHWANQKIYGHNPDRTIPSGRFKIGENIYWYGTSNKNYIFDPDMALDYWWNENKDFKYHSLANSDFVGTKEIGHYTQMAWSDSTRLGCGISQYYKGGWNNFFVVCVYGPAGNYLGLKPYETGEASGRLECAESDCTQKYGESC